MGSTPRSNRGFFVAPFFTTLGVEKMNSSKFLVSAIAAAAVAGVVGLSYAQTSTNPSTSSGAISDTGKATKPAGANETPGPSTNTQTAPSGSGANTTGSTMDRNAAGSSSTTTRDSASTSTTTSP